MCEKIQRTVYLLKRTDKSYDGTDIYVGSTSLSLKRRLQFHKSASRLIKNCNIKLYKKMCEVGLNNWEMVSLFSISCDKKTILKFEKEQCKKLNSNLNMRSPFTGLENRKDYFVNYHKLNKEKILQQKADYRELNKQKKLHYCDVCEKAFGSNSGLKKHFYSLKHQHTYLNSLD